MGSGATRIPAVRSNIFTLCWSMILGSIALLACATPTTEPTASTIPEPTSEPSPVPEASPTPIPHVLFIGSEAVEWEDQVAAWALDRGWHLNVPDNLATASQYLLESGLPKMAISIGEGVEGDLEQAASEGLLVVAFEVPGLEVGPTLSVVQKARLDQAGFLAGLMTGLASQTGWIGEVTDTDGRNEAEYRAGFSQGMLLGCPKCQVISQTAEELSLDRFRANTVDAVWIVPGEGADGMMETLTAAGFPLVWIGDEGPPEALTIGRIAVVDETELVFAAMEDLLATGDGKFWQPSIETGAIDIHDINPVLLSPGRQRLLDEAYEAIVAGDLDIGTAP